MFPFPSNRQFRPKCSASTYNIIPTASTSLYGIENYNYLDPLESSEFKQFNKRSNTCNWNSVVEYLPLSKKNAEEVLRKKYVYFKENGKKYNLIDPSYKAAFEFLEQEEKQRADEVAAANKPLTNEQQQAINNLKLKKEQEQKEKVQAAIEKEQKRTQLQNEANTIEKFSFMKGVTFFLQHTCLEPSKIRKLTDAELDDDQKLDWKAYKGYCERKKLAQQNRPRP